MKISRTNYRNLPVSVWRAALARRYVRAAWLQARHYQRSGARTIRTLTVLRDFDFDNLKSRA